MDTLLFADGDLGQCLAQTAQAMVDRLENWDPDELLKAPEEDIIEWLVDVGSVHCPTLQREQAWMPQPPEIEQTLVDFGRSFTRRVTRFVLVVPFEGEKVIFTLRANRYTLSPPRVLRIRDHEVRLFIDNPPDDPDRVKMMFDEQIDKLDEYLSWARAEIDAHNHQIRSEVPGMVAKRREHLLASRNLQAQIGYPVRRRPDADSYSVPMKRRTVRPEPPRPTGGRAPFKPEPAMNDKDYYAALDVLRDQRNALERTPSLASRLKEEEIRDLLLIGLNAQFKGDVAGEVFNGEGKTDILIRVDDRNIFIGECKVWAGPRTMDEALGQLFSYLVWRDTKAAILLFIRNKDATAVIDKAVQKIESHPNYKGSNPRQERDGEYGYTLHAQDDPAREIHLTLIPFALRNTEPA